MAVRRCLLQGLLKQAYHSIGVESSLNEMGVVRGQHETAFCDLLRDIDPCGEELGMHVGRSERSIKIRTAIVLSQFCRMPAEIPGRCGVGEPLEIRHWCRGSGGIPSRGTWAAVSHSMPGEPSCPERKSVQIRSLVHRLQRVP